MPRAIRRLNLEGIFSLIYHKGVLRYIAQEPSLEVRMVSLRMTQLASPRTKGTRMELQPNSGWVAQRLLIL